jgi:hypothetical protein
MTGQMDDTEPAEVSRLEAELASLSLQLSGAEAALVSSRARLEIFTRARDKLLLPLHAELDDIEAQNAEILADGTGRADDLRDSRKARERARASAEAARVAARRPAGPPLAPAPRRAEAGRLYRALISRCHPDLCRDEADRRRREPFIARANDAYARGDIDALHALARQWDTADATGARPTAAALRASVLAARRRLAAARAQLAEVRGGKLGRWLFYGSWDAGQDPQVALHEQASRLRARIAQQQRLLDDLRSHTPHGGK